jgi:hypothetical protein
LRRGGDIGSWGNLRRIATRYQMLWSRRGYREPGGF